MYRVHAHDGTYSVQKRVFMTWWTVQDGFPTEGDAQSWINLNCQQAA